MAYKKIIELISAGKVHISSSQLSEGEGDIETIAIPIDWTVICALTYVNVLHSSTLRYRSRKQ
jgi:hypothetical protein